MAEPYSGFIIVRLSAERFVPLPGYSRDLRAVAQRIGAIDLLDVLNEYSECKSEPVVSSVEPSGILELERKAASRGSPVTHSLTSYWRLDARSVPDPNRLLARLTRVDVVEHAYRELSRSDPTVDPSDDPFSDEQKYLDAAPIGIDARWAWSRRHGSGASVGFVDLEQGWILNHEDLPTILALPGVGQDVNPLHERHGTAVLGIVAGVDNTKGIIGIAPTPAWVSVASHFRASDGTEGLVAEAITSVVYSGQMAEGDVLLLEVTTNNLPIEVDEVVLVSIQLATGLGFVVVEAAGNGNLDLDDYPSLNRTAPEFQESQATLVGASMSALDATGVGHDRWVLASPGPGSNFGSRVDCYAYGENVATAGPPPPSNPAGELGSGTGPTNRYRKDFGGTSAAAAIVAGAAVVLQGMNKAVTGVPLTSDQMRNVLGRFGTPQGTGQAGHIGVMPDLKKAAHALSLTGPLLPAPAAPTGLRIQR
jgi:serine protease